MKYKLIVFDLNETLINTNEIWSLVIPRAISNNFDVSFENAKSYWVESAKGIWEISRIDRKRNTYIFNKSWKNKEILKCCQEEQMIMKYILFWIM